MRSLSEVKSRHDEMLDQFDAFHKENPDVWNLFQRFTFEKIKRGHKHYSAKGIYERIRWEVSRPDPQPCDFKLNNNYTAMYARWFMTKYPQYDGFFRTREQTSLLAPPTKLPPLGPRDYE